LLYFEWTRDNLGINHAFVKENRSTLQLLMLKMISPEKSCGTNRNGHIWKNWKRKSKQGLTKYATGKD